MIHERMAYFLTEATYQYPITVCRVAYYPIVRIPQPGRQPRRKRVWTMP